MADRYDALAPKDLIITLRSLRRRFDEVVGPVLTDPDLKPRIDEVGAGGASMGQLVDGAAQDLALLGEAVEAIISRAEPSVPDSVGQPAKARSGERQTLDKAAQAIGDRADAMADHLDDVEPDGWNRTATTGNGTIDLVTVARHAVRSGVEGLRASEQQLTELRGY